ncbi:hypothetical protein G4D82_14215, partial [Flavobacterium sp. CYK-4]|nr:hypothetical protein [Flavobacterium lotistagni]
MKNLYSKSMTQKLQYLAFLFVVLTLGTFQVNAQVNVGFTQRTSQYSPTKKIYTVKGDFTMLGNTFLSPQNYSPTTNNNNQFMTYIDTDNDPTTINSSSSTLTLSTENGAVPSCSNIVYAGLYWTAKSSREQTFSVTKNVQNGTQPINNNLTVNHSQNIANTNYSMTVSRNSPSNNNRNPIYTFNGGSTYVFNFYNASATNRVTVSINGNPAVNVPVTVNGANTEATLITPIVIADGAVNITIKKLIRSAATDLSTSSTQDTSSASVNVTGNAPAYTPLTKTLDKRALSLKGPSATSYTRFTAEPTNIYYPYNTEDDIFAAYVEITDYVKEHGIGEYFAADMAVLEGDPGGTGYSGGWGMIVVYENHKMKYRDVTIFDGYAYVKHDNANGYTLPVNGFNTVQTGTVGIKMGMMASEGDVDFTGDYFQIRKNSDGSYMSLNHTGNSTTNFFNSSINAGGARNPNLVNNTGIDICMFNVPNSGNSVIGNSQTSTTFKYGTSGDTYSIFAIAFAVDAYVPMSESMLTAGTINNVTAVKPYTSLPGQIIGCNVNVKNLGTEPISNYKMYIPIPYNATYVAGSAVGTILFTPNPTPNNIYFDQNMGAYGTLVWDFGTLPLPANPSNLLANLTFKLKATEDCNILNNATCGSQIVINGLSSGVGAITGIVFNNNKMIEGYEDSGPCIGLPMPQTLTVGINATGFLGANCPNMPALRELVFCNGGNTVSASAVAANFPAGSLFYDSVPVTPSSIQYTNSNPFPLPASANKTYYAIPPTGIAGCSFPFTIRKCKVIDAVNDNGANIVGAIGGISITNVLTNDTMNGASFAASEVNLTFVSATNPGITLSGNSVLVAAGTPAGTYTLTYQICEVASPANCDTAVVTVRVLPSDIDANNDVGLPISGYVGGIGYANVLVNDTLNGVLVNPSQVITTFVSSNSPGVTLSGTDVMVAAGTPAGTYVLNYQICEVLNPSNCDTTTVKIIVTSAPIDAVNDIGTPINGASGGTAFTNVLVNDTLNGAAVIASQVNTTFVSSTNAGVTLSGTNVVVAAGTPAGTYTLTYQICEKINPANCDSATVSVSVNAPAIIANDDTGTTVNGLAGGTAFTNVLVNDTLNGVAVLASQVNTTFVSSTNAGVTLSGTDVLVAAGTPAGTYTLTYQICEILNPSNCDTAIVTVTVSAASIIANDDTGTTV